MMAIGPNRKHLFLSASRDEQDRVPEKTLDFHAMQQVQLLHYFLDLTKEERIARFGNVTSDETIRRWWVTVETRWYCAVGLEDNGRLVGLAELFGSQATGWKRPELAVSVRGPANSHARAQLVQSALDVARMRGASDIIVCGASEGWTYEIACHFGGTIDADAETMILAVVPFRPVDRFE
jgi:hypothetical protein